MKTLVVIGHPELADSETQPFLKQVGKDWATFHELEAPFDIATEQQLIWQAERLILQFPLYWYSVPALMKQWLDEVFDEELLGPHHDRLVKKELGVVVSLGRPIREFQSGQRQAFTIDEYLRPLQGLALATKMKWLSPLVVSQFAYQSDTARQKLAVAYQQYLSLPQPVRFKDRVAWLTRQLATMQTNTKDTVAQQELQQLAALLSMKQEQLDDLNDNLRLVRETEGY
ncbi:NAD(P)H-dependent oxidoreductase [Lactobacillus sp. 3B(2020)]|uniref:NAD(P)H-dependent oxidoreductase n=1 Tax=Lactobacillus sp. 3B(2020) TaxID=2695882 RepID=UPI0015DD628C|nr:NAD(P)H-dependent oxidoreductase [Lactobacillus sp. 3B(2020)]QLL70914.1 flavodoxin family protein [Lactobacillus sp. 3B(2020)]